ncbi:hypothetical protein M3Y96_00307700 [Aphelenchoides besseyi]|nr:hypothetical protein M3Y96_00307700 [Aphelenchoides besseyi]
MEYKTDEVFGNLLAIFEQMSGRQVVDSTSLGCNPETCAPPIFNVSTMFKRREFPLHSWQIHNVDLFLQSNAQKVCQAFGPLDDYDLRVVFEMAKKRKKLRLQLIHASQKKKVDEVVHSSLLKIKLTASNDADWKSEFVLDVNNPKSKYRFKLPDSVMKGHKSGSLFVSFKHEVMISTSRKEDFAEIHLVDTMPKELPFKPQLSDQNEKLLSNQKPSTETRKPINDKSIHDKTKSLPMKQEPAMGDYDASKSPKQTSFEDDEANKLAGQLASGLNRKRNGGSQSGSDWSVVQEKDD